MSIMILAFAATNGTHAVPSGGHHHGHGLCSHVLAPLSLGCDHQLRLPLGAVQARAIAGFLDIVDHARRHGARMPGNRQAPSTR